MPYQVDFIDPKTGKTLTSNPIITNLGEAEIVKMAKETLIEDRLSSQEELKGMRAQIRVV